jgi:hypothetical protein
MLEHQSHQPYFMVFHQIANLQYNLNKRCIQLINII